MTTMRRLIVLSLALALTAGALACGKTKRDTARLLGFMSTKSSTSLTTEIRKQAEGQALLQKFAAESGQSFEPQFDVKSFEEKTSVTIGDAGYTCEASSVDEMSAAIACTTTADDKFSCGSDTYTVKSGATMKLAFSISGSNVFTFYLEEKATVTGASFGDSGKAIDCKIKMEWDLTKLQAAAASGSSVDPYDFKCSGDMKCKVGSDEITCDDLKSAMNDYAKDSANACKEAT